MGAVLNDPAKLELWLRRINEQHKEGQEPATEATLMAYVGAFGSGLSHHSTNNVSGGLSSKRVAP